MGTGIKIGLRETFIKLLLFSSTKSKLCRASLSDLLKTFTASICVKFIFEMFLRN